MKIGIMGGTFDPIHNAHLIIAAYAREQFGLDELVFMTGGNPPHKTGVTDKYIRNEMTKLAVGNDFEISDYEVEKEEYSYTLRTLEYMKAKYPEDELFFIIGEDSLRDIGKWYHPEEILKLCTLLVFPRNAAETLEQEIAATKERFGGKILAVDAPVFGISSSEIRERIRQGKSVKHMLPEPVWAYIREHGLYQE